MRKKFGLAALTFVLSLASAQTALAGWSQDDFGWWYQYDNGLYAKSGIREVEGQNYCFNSYGYMQTGWQYVNWKWYYFDVSGPQVLGWAQLDGKWYYLDPEDGGAMYTYWLELPDAKKKGKRNRYYLDESGVLQTGRFSVSEGTNGEIYTYEADENGVLVRNKTKKANGVEIKYDDSGVIRFRTAETKKRSREEGTEEWQYLLSESELQRIYENQVEQDYEEYDDYEDYDY